MHKFGMLIFWRIVCIPTPTIWVGKIIGNSNGAIIKLRMLIKFFNKLHNHFNASLHLLKKHYKVS